DPPSPYEDQFGFSRLVTAGELVIIGGTTSISPDGVVIGESPYEQAVEILRKVTHELARGGATPEDVIQVRIYVTDISRGAEVGRGRLRCVDGRSRDGADGADVGDEHRRTRARPRRRAARRLPRRSLAG